MTRRTIKLFMRGIVMSKKVFRLPHIIVTFFGLMVWGVFYGATTVHANTLDIIGDLTEKQQTIFSQNDILFYNPGECVPRSGSGGNVSVEGCFKVNDGTSASDFWYAEGCIDNGTCTTGTYTRNYKFAKMNPLIYTDTETDEDFGGMQYIYAENYDIEFDGYDGWITKLTKKSDANSNRKYYWVVLPDQAYTTRPGETYVATFENLSEPVYFIVYDAHACQHQSENYCGKASASSDGVAIGKEFFGAFTKRGGNSTDVVSKAGKLTSLCRINGKGEVTASTDGNTTVAAGSGSETTEVSVSTDSSSGAGGCDFTKYNYSDEDLKRLAAIAASENGDNIESLKNEMSLMANLYESSRGSKYSSVLDYVLNGGWFGSGKKGISGDNASSEQFAAAKDVFNNGNRTLPKEVDEHDCIDCGRYGYDITKIEIDGKTITSQDGLKDADNYVKNKTILHNKYGATYTFYTWANPDNPVRSDPMGYTGDSVACEPGGNNCSGSVVLKNVEDYPQYKQQTGHTCGPTSMAMLVSYGTGQTVTENDIISVIGGDRVYVGGDRVAATKKVCEKYGCEAKQIESTEDAIRAALKDGWMVHYSGSGDGSSYATNPFGSSAGHYVGIFGIDDDDQVVVANSAYQGNKKMSLHDAVKGHKGLPTMAIKFANAGGGVCEEVDYCEGDDENSDASGASGDVAALQELVKKWAWPEYKGRGFTQRMPEYADAISQGGYSGSCNGVDCAAFVYQLITKSGWDPDFPTGPVRSMISALENSSTWQEVTSDIKSNSDARPGDVIIKYAGGTHHVVIYVGDIDGFESPIASASQCGRAPMADRSKDITSYIGQGYHVFRKK